jgi:hypothetical protein
MTDDSKISKVSNCFYKYFPGCKVIPQKYDTNVATPYCFQIINDSLSLAIIFIDPGLWDDDPLWNDDNISRIFDSYDLINSINNNVGRRLFIGRNNIKQIND